MNSKLDPDAREPDVDAGKEWHGSELTPVTLTESAMFSYANLIGCLLSCDFAEDYNRDFRHETLTLVAKHLKLSDKTKAAIEQRFTANNGPGDITTYIVVIREDPAVKENGALLIPSDLISLFIGVGNYDSRCRVLARQLSALLAVDWRDVVEFEGTLADSVQNQSRYKETEAETSDRRRRERNRKLKRYALIGTAGTIGGVLIGLTGGLAAPLFAAGAGVFIGAGAAAGIATTAGAAVLGSLFGVAGAGFAGYKMKKRVGAIEEFVIETLTSAGPSLHVVVTVSGWIAEDREDAFTWPWRFVEASKEQYSLRYESKYLLQMGNLVEYLYSFAVSYAIQGALMETALAGVLTAVAWPAVILSAGSVIDNPWSVCVRRAEEVGTHLAQLLLSRQQGQRPVTLMGFSLGARVIYHCLVEMSKRKNHLGIVEDVILLGAPVTGSPSDWMKIHQVVAGRIVNGYSKTDWMLKFLYRTMNAQLSIAGTGPIRLQGCPKICNVDLTHLISGHSDYQHKLGECLEAVGVPVNQEHSNVRSESSVMLTFPSSASQAQINVEKFSRQLQLLDENTNH